MHPTFIENDKNYVWLLKPTNLNRGRYLFNINIYRGIKVLNTIEQLEKYLNEFFEGLPEYTFENSIDKS